VLHLDKGAVELIDNILMLCSYRPVARFQDLVGHNTFLGGQDFRLYCMFKTNFSGCNKIWRGTAPECPRGYGPVFILYSIKVLPCLFDRNYHEW